MEELALGVYDEKFQNPLIAADYLESIRWPDGPVCPHCGESERKPYLLKSKTRKLWKCAACRKQYTVTVGTIFEGSHIGLHKWLLAFYLLEPQGDDGLLQWGFFEGRLAPHAPYPVLRIIRPATLGTSSSKR